MRMVRMAVPVFLVLGLTFAVGLRARQQPERVDTIEGYRGFQPGFIVLEGQVENQIPMGLVLAVDGDPNPHGWYFTAPTFEDYAVAGQWMDDGMKLGGNSGEQLSLRYIRQQSSAKPGEPLALFNITALTGAWSSPSGEQQLTLQMGFSRGPRQNGRWYDFGTSDQEIEKNAQAFLRAVEDRNARAASLHIDYPLTTFVGKRKVKIRNPQEFLRLCNRILPPGASNRAKMALPHEMFSRMGNAMVLQGEVWFSSKGAVSEWLSTSSPKMAEVTKGQ